jgi:predicted RNA-binding protein
MEEKINIMNRAHFALCDELIVYITELEEKIEKLDATTIKKKLPGSKIYNFDTQEEKSFMFN